MNNTANSKTKHSYKFVYNFTDKVNLKNPNKNIALANLSVYYRWGNVKSDYNNNKFKISAPTWNDIFDVPDVLIQLLLFKIILNTSLKNMKPLLMFLQC